MQILEANSKPHSDLILPEKYRIHKRVDYNDVIPKGFKTLPVSILIKIFQYLPLDDVLKRASLVCKHWRFAAFRKEFIKSFHVFGPDFYLPYIYDHFRKFKQVESLYLDTVPNPTVILFQAEKFGIKFKKLSFKNLKNMDVNLLRYIILKFPKLTALELENTSFGNNQMKYSVISEFKHLKTLSLSNIKNIKVRDLVETVLNCSHLEELTIEHLPAGAVLRDEDAILIISNIATQLRHLSIDAHSLTSKTFEKLTECSNLKSLFINYGVNFDRVFLLDMLNLVPKLIKFGFTNNSIVSGNDICDVLMANTTDFTEITHLDFSFCVRINQVGIDAIRKCCKNLRTLILRSCRSVTDINKLCKTCKQLSLLNIAFCSQLKIPFYLPRNLEKLIVHEQEHLDLVLKKLRVPKSVIVYKVITEYDDEVVRL